MSFWHSTKHLIKLYSHLEWTQKERVLTPILLGLSMLLMFSFALGEFDQSLRYRIFIGQGSVTLLFSLQLFLSRSFEFDQRDLVFDLLKSYPISPASVFLSKFFVSYVLCLLLAIPSIFFAGLFLQILSLEYFLVFISMMALALVGLVALGILLTAMTMLTSHRQILYPMIFFPLVTPVLLALVQVMLEYQDHGFNDKVWNWLGLLGAFDAIYLAISIGLFYELFDES